MQKGLCTASSLMQDLIQNPAIAPVARYHSLAADEKTIPDCLSVTARTADGEIMAVQHKEYKIFGVQFHPESILTPCGKQMLANFICC